MLDESPRPQGGTFLNSGRAPPARASRHLPMASAVGGRVNVARAWHHLLVSLSETRAWL